MAYSPSGERPEFDAQSQVLVVDKGFIYGRDK